MPPPITLSTPMILGIVLAGFLAGFLIAFLMGNGRTRRVAGEGEARAGALKRDLKGRESELDSMRTEVSKVRADADARNTTLNQAQAQAAELAAQLKIAQAQLEELEAGSGEIEDRLNAAEARALTADAEVAQNRADIAQWSTAYTQLKSTHARLTLEHGEAQERRTRLEEELKARRSELQELSTRLEALQQAQSLQLEVRSADAGALHQTMASVSLAHAEAEAALRAREVELSELRSQTASMRYSLNVLTASGAQLAEMLADQNVIDAEAQWLDNRAPVVLPVLPTGEPASESLADLQGIIQDWFGEVEHRIPYDRHTLLLFGGLAHEDRGAITAPQGVAHMGNAQPGAGQVIDATASGAGETEGEGNAARPVTARRMPDLPPALMLAAIKAATATALERSSTRQFELAHEVEARQQQLDALRERVLAWRAMLSLTLSDDPDTLHLLDDQIGADPVEMLSACATVALTAYQKKAGSLAHAQGLPPALPGPTRLPPALPVRARR